MVPDLDVGHIETGRGIQTERAAVAALRHDGHRRQRAGFEPPTGVRQERRRPALAARLLVHRHEANFAALAARVQRQVTSGPAASLEYQDLISPAAATALDPV